MMNTRHNQHFQIPIMLPDFIERLGIVQRLKMKNKTIKYTEN